MSSVKLGTYEHYKGKHYEVIGLGRVEATLEDMVIYRPLYKTGPQDPLFWLRPVAVFLETVVWEGKEVPRFRYLGNV